MKILNEKGDFKMIKGTPSFDAKIGDTILTHKNVEVYYTFKDNDDNNHSASEYWFTLYPDDAGEEFDIRTLPCYTESLSNEEILEIAIDQNLIN